MTVIGEADEHGVQGFVLRIVAPRATVSLIVISPDGGVRVSVTVVRPGRDGQPLADGVTVMVLIILLTVPPDGQAFEGVIVTVLVPPDGQALADGVTVIVLIILLTVPPFEGVIVTVLTPPDGQEFADGVMVWVIVIVLP